MLRNLRIGPRLIFLIAIQLLILVVVGATGLYGLNLAARSTEQLNRNVAEGTLLSYVAESIRGDLLTVVNDVERGNVSWQESRERLAVAEQQFEEDWSRYRNSLTQEEAEFAADTLEPGLVSLRRTFARLRLMFREEDREELADYVQDDLRSEIDPFLNAVLASSAERQLASAQTFASSVGTNRKFLNFGVIAISLGLLASTLLGFFIYRSISRPVGKISGTVRELMEGNYAVRTELSGRDELGQLGAALDGLLEDKVTTLVQAEQENEMLNDSVIRVMEAVARMSQRDLTVRVPVAADVTGPVADAMNLMAAETSKVLSQVTHIAADVQTASNLVNDKAVSVNSVANEQLGHVEATAGQLTNTAKALNDIAQLAEQCDAAAEQATQTTEAAVGTVQETLASMQEIHGAIQETERRIRTLGERSKEITSVVDIINSIAERTHVLALNASMHASAAGEAGRSFAVVANEVRKLAESSHDSTARISALVNNIQIDTHDTIATMDRTISQVEKGSSMAEAAGSRMIETQRSTSELVNSVKLIASSSAEQAKASDELRAGVDNMLEGTRATVRELDEQLAQTSKLADYSRQLISSVRVFKLPEQSLSGQSVETPRLASVSNVSQQPGTPRPNPGVKLNPVS